MNKLLRSFVSISVGLFMVYFAFICVKVCVDVLNSGTRKARFCDWGDRNQS